MEELTLSVSDFVAVLNQTLEYAYPSVTIIGEIANFRVSKGKWVYFDLKDDYCSVKFFGTVYQLNTSLEDGLMLQVRGVPRLHPQYGFSVNVQFMSPVGEGSIKKASALLEAKLQAEGLFEPARKRPVAYAPHSIGLITSGESAAYHDFVKILNERWGGVTVQLADVQVQGEPAIEQIVSAIEYFNTHANPVEVLVITRGGGSAEDLSAFSTEQVTRAVAGSRIPTVVAIGHEVDISLAELVADLRASTPSNAVQLLVPDKQQVMQRLVITKTQLHNAVTMQATNARGALSRYNESLHISWDTILNSAQRDVLLRRQILSVLSPEAILERGYAIIRKGGKAVQSIQNLKSKDRLTIQLQDGTIQAGVE